jgi:hypothetical protein
VISEQGANYREKVRGLHIWKMNNKKTAAQALDTEHQKLQEE